MTPIYSPLKSMPYAQAKVKRTNNRISLISYSTTVAEIIGGVLQVYGLYSRTTIRHLSAFAKECCGTDYYTAKKCYTERVGYDIVTKKFVSVN
jgi:hypothetical protein